MNARFLILSERAAEAAADLSADAALRSAGASLRADHGAVEYWRIRSAQMGFRAGVHQKRVEAMLEQCGSVLQ